MSLRLPFNRYSSTRGQGAGGVFEESDGASHHASQQESEYPATAEGSPPGSAVPPAGNSAEQLGAPLVPPGYQNLNPAGPGYVENGQQEEGRKKRVIPLWARWCACIALLIIIILAIVLGAVLGTRNNGGTNVIKQPVQGGNSTASASSTLPSGVLATSSLASLSSSVGVSASDASATTSPFGGASASDSASDVASSPTVSPTDGLVPTSVSAGPSPSGSTDSNGSSVVISPSDSPEASGGSSDGVGPTPTSSTDYEPCPETTTRKTARPTPTYYDSGSHGKFESDQRRHYSVAPCSGPYYA